MPHRSDTPRLSFLTRNRVPLLVIAAYLPLAYVLTGTTCLMKATTGVPCPGCGLTRSVILGFEGNFSAAFHMHPLFPLGLLLLVGIPLSIPFLSRYTNRRSFVVAGGVILFLFIAVYVIRMIQGFPSSTPMDYNTDSIVGRILAIFF